MRETARACAGARAAVEWDQTSTDLAELVDEYLPSTTRNPRRVAKLGWLLSKMVSGFGERRLGELAPQEIAAWRMTIQRATGSRRPRLAALSWLLGVGVEVGSAGG